MAAVVSSNCRTIPARPEEVEAGKHGVGYLCKIQGIFFSKSGCGWIRFDRVAPVELGPNSKSNTKKSLGTHKESVPSSSLPSGNTLTTAKKQSHPRNIPPRRQLTACCILGHVGSHNRRLLPSLCVPLTTEKQQLPSISLPTSKPDQRSSRYERCCGSARRQQRARATKETRRNWECSRF